MGEKLPSSYHFSLAGLFYPATLFAVSLALFGVWGVLAGSVIAGFWAIKFIWQIRLRDVASLLVIAAIIGAIAVLLMPRVQINAPPPRPPHSKCWNNLQILAIALHSYQAKWGSFPPAVVSDDDGRPMHSWRVLILPELGWSQLYDQYDFDEPWNGPSNLKLADKMPGIFSAAQCSSHFANSSRQTAYVAVVGPRASWTTGQAIKFGNITDEHERTILLVEMPERPVNWMEPIDVSAAEAARLLSNPKYDDRFDGHQKRKEFVDTIYGRGICFVNGRVCFSAHSLDVDFASSLLRRDDELPADEKRIDDELRPLIRWRYDRIFILTLFAMLSLYPIVWVARSKFRRPLPAAEMT
ncbi:MAG: hypothetical protein ACI9G1_000543 [Pirellulaceae bacterium]|jgi:hypothetical protein